MKEYIEKAEIYKEIAELEELARNRVLDTPTTSPAYARYVAQLNERTELKHKIYDFPTAGVVEVRHGRWMTTDAYPHHLYCSVCYKTYAKNAKWVNELDLPTNYCPNCGARMDKEDEYGTD